MWGGVRGAEVGWTDRETPGDRERDSFVHSLIHPFSKLSLGTCSQALCWEHWGNPDSLVLPSHEQIKNEQGITICAMKNQIDYVALAQ